MFTTGVRMVGKLAIVDCSGRLTIGEGVLTLRETIRRILNDGVREILLKCPDISYVDSSGTGELVSVFTNTRNKGGLIALVQPTAKLRDYLQMTSLIRVFDVFDDEETAIAALKK